MSWLNYKDSMLNSLSLGDAFPPIVMLLWQRGSTRRGQVWIKCKGTDFLPQESDTLAICFEVLLYFSFFFL